MTLMSTPTVAIHVGIAIQTRPRGSPEEKESSATESRRQLDSTVTRPSSVVRRSSRPASCPDTGWEDSTSGWNPRRPSEASVAVIVKKYGGSSVAELSMVLRPWLTRSRHAASARREPPPSRRRLASACLVRSRPNRALSRDDPRLGPRAPEALRYLIKRCRLLGVPRARWFHSRHAGSPCDATGR